MKSQVLIVEGDLHTRHFFSEIVVQSGELELVAALGCVAEAKSFLNKNYAVIDVLLIDLDFPDGGGLEVIAHAKSLNSATESLVLSTLGEEDKVLASMEEGAFGYIYKDESPANILNSILSMRSGTFPMSPTIARMVLDRYLAAQKKQHALPVYASNGASRVPNIAHEVQLSKRENDVLHLISRGYSYGEIGRMRELSITTVQTYVKSLYRKLAVNSKTEAIFEAIRIGLISK